MTKIIYRADQDLDNYIEQMKNHGKDTTTNKEFNLEYVSIYDTQRLCRSRVLRNWKEYRDTQYKTVDVA